MVNCPGMMTVGCVFGLGLLLYLGLTEMASGCAATRSGAAARTGAGAGSVAGAWPATGTPVPSASGCSGVAAEDCAGELSASEFWEWMWNAIPTMTSRMMPRAAAIAYMKSLGGVFLISLTAFFATSRGGAFGFSGGVLL